MGDKRDVLARIPNNVICHGRAKQIDIPRYINGCHYTVLIRKPSLRTNAGFSTKMVESFAAGVPMIANITGDIGSYLKNGVNGIVVEDDTVKACAEAIQKALNALDKNDDMRSCAFETAEIYFDYRKYINLMKGYLSTQS
jgi:glycosyltransferase involved in cell wall biosynthesis